MSNELQRRGPASGTVIVPPLSLDVAFEVLADADRRAVLAYLRQCDDHVDVDELAAHVAGGESRDDGRVATSLRHCHLPKLAAVDLVSYDPNRGTAFGHDAIQELEPYLEWASQYD